MLAAIFHHHLVLNPSKSVSLWQHTCATSYQGLWQSNSLSANVALLQSRSTLLPAFYSNPEMIRNISKYKHAWQGRKAALCCGQFLKKLKRDERALFFLEYQGSVKRHRGYDWSYWKSSRNWPIKPLLWPLAREKQLLFQTDSTLFHVKHHRCWRELHFHSVLRRTLRWNNMNHGVYLCRMCLLHITHFLFFPPPASSSTSIKWHYSWRVAVLSTAEEWLKSESDSWNLFTASCMLESCIFNIQAHVHKNTNYSWRDYVLMNAISIHISGTVPVCHLIIPLRISCDCTMLISH